MEMAPGERLIWAERPLPLSDGRHALLRPASGLLLAGFALFWIRGALRVPALLAVQATGARRRARDQRTLQNTATNRPPG